MGEGGRVFLMGDRNLGQSFPQAFLPLLFCDSVGADGLEGRPSVRDGIMANEEIPCAW